ncbi:hypothetical protein V5O48_003320 [Marasmius crinis-equi]|uniref:TLC domain-containing protein n=1 Tax=Marasmius crinis-equi TaxID=585013 RepID=A0ABR3FTQ5_9AGAR
MTTLALPGTQALSEYLTPYILSLNLTKLPPHLPTALSSLILFTFTQAILGPILSNLFSSTYPTLSKRQKTKWSMHIVSELHVVIVFPLALSYLSIEALDKDRLYGWDDRVGTLQAISVGYFAWDFGMELGLMEDWGFILHGASCLAIYTYAFSPFLSYFATRCLLWEMSTFFLNIHWFLDKTNQTGGTLQLINGFFLLAAFFFVRICHGMYTSYKFWRAIQNAQDMPFNFYIIYCAGNIALNGLNVMWFSKMISALRKRFSSKANRLEANGHGKIKAPKNGKTE